MSKADDGGKQKRKDCAKAGHPGKLSEMVRDTDGRPATLWTCSCGVMGVECRHQRGTK